MQNHQRQFMIDKTTVGSFFETRCSLFCHVTQLHPINRALRSRCYPHCRFSPLRGLVMELWPEREGRNVRGLHTSVQGRVFNLPQRSEAHVVHVISELVGAPAPATSPTAGISRSTLSRGIANMPARYDVTMTSRRARGT